MIGAQASTSDKRIRASVAVVDAGASVYYVLPVAALSYIELTLSASLDTLNKNPYIGDSTVVLDAAFLEVIKKFSDASTVSDYSNINFGKNPSDSISLSETVKTLLIFIRNFSDTVSVSEQVAIDAIKHLADMISLSDADSRAFSKFVPDGVAMQDGADVADGLITVITKYVMNMAFVDDVKFVDFSKLLSDTFTQTDSHAIDFSRPLFDSFGFTDAQTIITDLAKADSATAIEQIYLALSKLISGDSVVFSDQIVNNLGKVLSDTAAPDDAGWLYAQNYCDITYFAEDYVGEYRTFT